MRKILRSETVVSCLVAVAVLSVTANFLKFPQRRAMSATAREGSTLLENSREESLNVPPTSRVEREMTGWREMFPLDTLRRDPFAASMAPPPAPVTNPMATPPVFHLQAISIDGDRVLAVINRRVVAEGEQIEGCRVEKILPTEVRLTSPFGPITATFDRTSRRNKSASVNPPAADLPASSPAVSPGGNGR
jgi:hypothetical protein